MVRGLELDSKTIEYQQRALQSVNERLSDPVAGVSEGIIGAVISFLTFNVGGLAYPHFIYHET